jgi:hypothetical protein
MIGLLPEINSGLAISGLCLSGYDPVTGALIAAEKVKGLGGTGSTIKVEQKVRGHGGWAGEAYASSRHFRVTGKVKGESLAVAETGDRLIAAVSREETVLDYSEFGRERFLIVRREDEVDWDHNTPNLADFGFQVVVTDYRKFAAPVTGSTLLPSTTGGLTIPFTVPFIIGATTITGQVSLRNPGTAPGPVRLRIDGPVVGPVITHIATGAQLVFSASLALGVGEFIEVDMEAHTVMANGQASRAGWVTSRGWSAFEPGLNTWTFTAAQFDPASKLTVIATPAWQ